MDKDTPTSPKQYLDYTQEERKRLGNIILIKQKTREPLTEEEVNFKKVSNELFTTKERKVLQLLY